MRLVLLAWVISLGLATPVLANNFQNCSPHERQIIGQSLDMAKELTLLAAESVGDTREYERWFGEYSAENAEQVRAGLKAIVSAIRRGRVTAACERIEPDGCAIGEYAYVYSDRPYLMHLCPSFFELPSMSGLRPGTRQSDFGTREGTVIHELSHFVTVAGTSDHCYSRSDCSLMAIDAPELAIENADSFQYFTEDVSYFARQPVGDKPPPAPRPNR